MVYPQVVISNRALKTPQNLWPGPFFSPVWGEEGRWNWLKAAERPIEMHGAGGSAKLLEEAAEIMKGRKGKRGQG